MKEGLGRGREIRQYTGMVGFAVVRYREKVKAGWHGEGRKEVGKGRKLGMSCWEKVQGGAGMCV